jgi:hypothetical protein
MPGIGGRRLRAKARKPILLRTGTGYTGPVGRGPALARIRSGRLLGVGRPHVRAGVATPGGIGRPELLPATPKDHP